MTDRGIKDANRMTSLFGVASSDGLTPIAAEITDATKRLRVDSLPRGAYDTFAQDASTEAATTIEYEHHEIHSGSHYFVQGYVDIPALGDVLDFTWQMPNTEKWTHWVWQIDSEKAITWYIYENVVATNPLANAITPLNSNRNSTNTSGTTMKYEVQADLAAANADTDVTSPAVLLASGSIGDNKTAGAANRQHELVMDQGKLYCLRAVATAAGYLNFDMNWYEHTDKN